VRFEIDEEYVKNETLNATAAERCEAANHPRIINREVSTA
jgi:hypothetical protein